MSTIWDTESRGKTLFSNTTMSASIENSISTTKHCCSLSLSVQGKRENRLKTDSKTLATYLWMNVCVFYACLCVCMFVCMFVLCMYVSMDVDMCVCILCVCPIACSACACVFYVSIPSLTSQYPAYQEVGSSVHYLADAVFRTLYSNQNGPRPIKMVPTRTAHPRWSPHGKGGGLAIYVFVPTSATRGLTCVCDCIHTCM